MKKRHFKRMVSLMLTLLMAFTLLPTTFAESEAVLEIVDDSLQSGQNLSNVIKFSAKIPNGATDAKVTVGGVELENVTISDSLRGEGYKTVTASVPQAATMSLGENILLLSATVSGNKETAESTITLKRYIDDDRLRNTDFTGAVDAINGGAKLSYVLDGHYSQISATVKKDNDNEKVYLENNDANPTEKDAARISFWSKNDNDMTKNDTSKNYRYDAKVILNFQATVAEGASLYAKMASQSQTFVKFSPDGWWYCIPVLTDGKFFGTAVDAEYGKSYDFTIIFDNISRTVEMLANGEKINTCTYSYEAASEEKIGSFMLTACVPETYVAIDNITVDREREYPASKSVSYEIGGATVPAKEGNIISMVAEKAIVEMSKAGLTIADGDVTFRRKGETAGVALSATIDGTTLTATLPANLTDSTEYELIISENAIYTHSSLGELGYGAKQIIPIVTGEASFNVLSPANGASVMAGDSVDISLTAPSGSVIKFYVDDVEIASAAAISQDGYVKTSIPGEYITAGRKTIKIVAEKNGVTDTKTIAMNVKNFIRSDYYVQNFNNETFKILNSATIEKNYSEGYINRNYYFNLAQENNDTRKEYIERKLKDENVNAVVRSEGDYAIPMRFVVHKELPASTFEKYNRDPGLMYFQVYSGNVTAKEEVKTKGNMGVFEFDVMFPEVSDYGLKVALWGTTYYDVIKAGSGKLGDKAIQNGQWIHIKIVADQLGSEGDTAKVSVYADNTLMKTQEVEVDDSEWSYRHRVSLTKANNWSADEANEKCYVPLVIDNVELYTLTPVPENESISYKKDNGEATLAQNDAVPCDAKEISFAFNQTFAADKYAEGDLQLWINGVKDESAQFTYGADNKTITVMPTLALTKYTEGKLVLTTNVKVQTVSTSNPDIELKLEKVLEIPFFIGDTEGSYFKARISESSENLKAEYVLINGGLEEKTAVIVFSAYESEGKLADIYYESKPVLSGEMVTRVRTISKASAKTAKAMLWDGFMQPYLEDDTYTVDQ